MKNLVIGDIHCKIDEVVFAVNKFKNGNYSKLIFIGDYVDSFTASDETMIECLQLIINTKKELGDSCILLWGNHDIQYRFFPDYRCSGFRRTILTPIQMLFKENDTLFQWYYYDEDIKTLFSHAGVNGRWVRQTYDKIVERFPKDEPYVQSILKLLYFCENTSFGRDLLCQCGESRGGYKYDAGGIVWADKLELETFPRFDNEIKHQVVGHTAIPNIYQWNNFDEYNTYEENTITFIDTLDKKANNYYEC
jgi:hypothetical protein